METYALAELTYKTRVPEWFIIDAFKPFEKLCYLVDGYVFIKATPDLLIDLQKSYLMQCEMDKLMIRKLIAENKIKEYKLSKLN